MLHLVMHSWSHGRRDLTETLEAARHVQVPWIYEAVSAPVPLL